MAHCLMRLIPHVQVHRDPALRQLNWLAVALARCPGPSGARVPDFPDVPTFAEQGYPELVASIWFSLSGPAGLPPAIVRLLNTEVRRALRLGDVRARLRPEGIEPGDLDPQAFTLFVAAEIRRWAPVIRASGAHAD